MRLAKNKMYRGWLLIVTILLMLLGCNEGSTARPSNLKAITAFSFPSANGPVNGTITGQNIAVTMPYGTNVTDLVATFTTTGASVSANGVRQVSGITPINFTNPVAYIVAAADGSTATYTVTVTVAASYHKAITAFSLNGTPGTISGQDIAVTMLYGTNVTALIATFTTTGTSVSVNGVRQVSGITPINFISPVSYIVTAADGTTRNYIVTVTFTLPATRFVGYYPSGCTLNNTAAGITGNCTCIKDTGTGNIWTTAGNTDDTWENWCNHTPGTPGYDPNCAPTSNKLDTWNNSAQCGLTGGWRLPTAPTPSSPDTPLSGTNPGGDWSDLYNIATSGSVPPGTAYTSGGDLSVWMNNNGFMNISNTNGSIGDTYPSYYWSAASFDSLNGWIVTMNSGKIARVEHVLNLGILLVHSGQ